MRSPTPWALTSYLLTLNTIFYAYVEDSPTKTIYMRHYMETHTETHTHTTTHIHYHTHNHTHTHTHKHTHYHTHTHTLTHTYTDTHTHTNTYYPPTHTCHDKPWVKKSNIPVWRVSPRFSSTCRQSCWQRQHRSAAHRCSCACSGRCLRWRPTSRCRTLDQPCCRDQQSQTPPGDSPAIGEILLFIICTIVGAWLHMPTGV